MAIFDFSDFDKKKKQPSQIAKEQVEKKKTTSEIFDFSDYKPRKTTEPLIKPAEPAKPSRLAQIKERLEPVGKFLLEKRKQIGEEIGRLAPIRPAYAPAPEGQPGAIEELEENYKNSLVGKFDDRFRTFEKSFITARTGGIIKPEYQSEDNLTNKVIAGVAQVAGASASLRSIGSIFDGVTKNAIPIKTLLERFPKVAKYAYPLVKNAVVFDIYGQLDPDLQGDFPEARTSEHVEGCAANGHQAGLLVICSCLPAWPQPCTRSSRASGSRTHRTSCPTAWEAVSRAGGCWPRP